MASTPTVSYGDSMTIGQVARLWGRSAAFVRAAVDRGDLDMDSRGLIANSELRAYYRQHGSPTP